MYNLTEIPEVINAIKAYSYVYKETPNFIEVFCCYCDDSTRRTGRLSHGHLGISKTFNFCQCFRCDHRGTASSFLREIGFTNGAILETIESTSNFTYSRTKKRNIQATFSQDIHEIIEKKHIYFHNTYPQQYNQFLNYVSERCYNINPLQFLIAPNIVENNLVCSFYNYTGTVITHRIINSYHKRYIKPKQTDYYYFQNIFDIVEYENIVICEGAFDIVNLYNYSTFDRDNSYYIALNGKFFAVAIKELILNYLLIGTFELHIVIDNDATTKDNLINNQIKFAIQKLNPNVSYAIYKPNLSKDVSEFMSYKLIYKG